MRLAGKVVLITGGAQGIGAETARQLVQAGARVALVDRQDAALRNTADALGGAAMAIRADVTDADQMRSAVDRVVAAQGGIDAMIAGAGIAGTAGSVRTIDPVEFERVIEVNLLGLWRSVRAVLPEIVARRGHVVVVSSIAALLPTPLMAAYGTSKAGVEAFGRSLRIELRPTGATAGVAYFGLVDTPMVTRDLLHQPATAHVAQAMPGAFGRPVPVGDAASAIVRGVERRSARVWAPRWVGPLYRARGWLTPLDAATARHPRFVEALRMVDTEARNR